MITEVGASVFTPGGIAFTVFSGFSPLLAVWVMHMLFTKVLKVASPMTPSGLKQWAKSSGSMTTAVAGAGGAAGGFLGSQAAQRLGRRFKNNMTDKVVGRADRMTGGMLSKVGMTKHSSTKSAQRAGGRKKTAATQKTSATSATSASRSPQATDPQTGAAGATVAGFTGTAADTRRARRGFELGTHDADGNELTRDQQRLAFEKVGREEFARNRQEDGGYSSALGGYTDTEPSQEEAARLGAQTLKKQRKERLAQTRADMAHLRAQDAGTKAAALADSTRRLSRRLVLVPTLRG